MNSKTAKVKDVSTDDGVLTVWLDDGRVVSAPLAWYPALAAVPADQRKEWQPSGAGRGIHWPALDYDLSVDGILAGRKEHPGVRRTARTTLPRARSRTKPLPR